MKRKPGQGISAGRPLPRASALHQPQEFGLSDGISNKASSNPERLKLAMRSFELAVLRAGLSHMLDQQKVD